MSKVELSDQSISQLSQTFERKVPRENIDNFTTPYGLGVIGQNIMRGVKQVMEGVSLRNAPHVDINVRRINEVYADYDFPSHAINLNLSMTSDNTYGLTGLETQIESILLKNRLAHQNLLKGAGKNAAVFEDPVYSTQIITDYLSGENYSLFWTAISDRTRRSLIVTIGRWCQNYLEIPQADTLLYTGIGIHEYLHGEWLAWAIVSGYFKNADEFDACANIAGLLFQEQIVIPLPEKTIRFLQSTQDIDIWQYHQAVQKYSVQIAKELLTPDQFKMYCKYCVFVGWSEAACFVSSRPFDLLAGLDNSRLAFDNFFSYEPNMYFLPEPERVEEWSDHCTCEIDDLGQRLYELSYAVFFGGQIQAAYEQLTQR